MSAALPRSHRERLRVAAVLAALVLALSASIVTSWLQGTGAGATRDGVLTGLVVGALAVVGAVIALAAPDNRVGPLLLAGGVLIGLGQAMTDAGVRGVVDHPGSVWGATYLAVTGPAVRAVGWVLAVVAVPALVPDGRLPGRRWRWLAWCVAAGALLLAAGILLMPRPDDRLSGWRSPWAPTGGWSGPATAASLVGAMCVAAGVVGAVCALVVRWRRREPVLRQQMLLLAVAAFPPAVVMVLVLALDGLPSWAFDIALLPLPAAIAVATLQRGLYDLRRAAHRTLLWLVMSGVVVAIYVLLVAVVAAVVPGGSRLWLPGLAAAVAALALVPLRDALQRGVTRVVYGRWREPYEVLAGLGGQLEAAGDIDRLLDETVAELRRGLDLTDVCLLDLDGGPVAGEQVAGTRIPLVAYGAPVGWLSYRSPNRPLSDSEQRVLRDLARHLGAAMHARMLRDDLLRTRERLVLAREEERRRLRRDLHDGIGPALAGLRLKAETARMLLPPGSEGADRQLRGLAEQIRSTVVDVRRVVEGLRPPALDELGLIGACEQAVARVTESAPVHAALEAGRDLPGLPAAVEVAAYRVVVEAVTNVVRHSGASVCRVELSLVPSALVVRVTDDGVGVPDAPDHGNGLTIMRERAEEVGGAVTVSRCGGGTRVEARLPVHVAVRPSAPERAPA